MLERARLWSAIFIKNPATAVALQKAASSLDRDEGNKEEAYVMVKSFEPGRGQAAFWASPRLVIYLDSSGLNTAYKNEGAPPLKPAKDGKMSLSVFALF
jgi:hypothetical protein